MLRSICVKAHTAGRVSTVTRSLASLPALHTPLSSALSETFVDPAEDVIKTVTLPNGLRVASVDSHGNGSSIAVYISSGSRDEDASNSGVSHLIQHHAFKSTQSRSAFRIVRETERLGANVLATSHHELTMFSADVLRPKALETLELLSDSILHPALLPWEIEQSVGAAMRDVEQLERNAPALVTEFMHTAGFHANTLGKPLYARKSQYQNLSSEKVAEFWKNQLSLDRIVVAGVNVNHEDLAAAASDIFSGLPHTAFAPREAAQYTGGDHRVEADMPSTTVGLAFNGASWSSPNIIHVSVLHALLGGGSSFSAGGPGKGLLSRLYTNVLNKYHDVKSANVFNVFYSDGGLFGLHAETSPELAGNLTEVLVQELHLAARSINPEELQRAKNQLKANILSNLEHRHVVVDDLGRQVLALGHRWSTADIIKKIDSVTANELTDTARQIFSTPLTFVAHGDLSSVPRYDEIASKFQ